MSQKLGGGCAFFSGGSWVSIEHKVLWAEAYLHTKWQLSPSIHLATRWELFFVKHGVKVSGQY